MAFAFTRAIGRLLPTLVLAIGAASLIGWHTGSRLLVTFGSAGTSLRYNAAMVFLLVGLAGLAARHDRRRLAQAAAAPALLLSGLTLLQHVFGLDLRIDELFFRSAHESPRMSPNAAFGLALGSGALIALARAPAGPILHGFTATTGAVISGIGITAAFGYAVDLTTTYVWQGLTPLSPPGALGLSLFGASLVSQAWSQAVATSGRRPSWIPIPVGVLVLTGGILVWQAFAAGDHGADAATRARLQSLLPGSILAGAILLALALAAVAAVVVRLLDNQALLQQAEYEARDQAALLKHTLEVLPLGVWISDGAGEITHVNAAGAAIWGGAPRVGVDHYDCYVGWWPGTDRRVASHEWALAQVLARREPVTNQVVDIRTFDGRRRTISTNAVPLLYGERLSGGVIVVQDITDLQQAQRTLAERTKELERSNADLEQFAYIASHDLQEPLRMVASFTQLLARRYRGRLDADADEYIHYVVDGTVRMQRLLSDLLEYSRVGRRGQAPRPLAAGEALADALANLQLAVTESGATVTAADLPAVMADRVQLAQVFQNLVGNALKFRADDRSPRVTVSGSAEGPEVHFTIEDNGIGMEARHIPRIFDIFRRLDTSGKYPGTGLGLAITQRIVSRHGGRIWVESTPGVGSRVHFTLPAATGTRRDSLERIA